MIHLVIGGGIILTAAAVSWLYNQKTDDELRRQRQAYQDRDDIRSKYQNASSRFRENHITQRREQALSYKSLLLKELDTHAKKVQPIVNAYNELFEIIQSEINADSTSPYRKSALRKEYARLEDAKLRIIEYDKYLSHERSKISELWAKGHYDWLMQRKVPDALLPVEWLYLGKLLVVDFSDIDKPLEGSRHILNFTGVNGEAEKQKALALSYGNEFPILVVKGQRNRFFGCVAKGIAFHDYIRLNRPLEIVVERYTSVKKQYLCSYFDGLGSVSLPAQNLIHTSLRCISGQRLEVYFDSFDATLAHDPFGTKIDGKKLPPPSVTEKAPSIQRYDELELYIEIDDNNLVKIPAESSFFETDTNWSFLSFELNDYSIRLTKGQVELECELTESLDGLRVKSVFIHKKPQIGTDLPFEFILITAELDSSDLFGWKYGIEQLLNFVSQLTISSTLAFERAKQIEFFKRWQHVVEYQRRQESERSVDFECIPMINQDKNTYYQLKIDNGIIQAATVNDSSVYSFMSDIEKSDSAHFFHSCRLLIWDEFQAKYIPAIERKKLNKVSYLLEQGNVFIDAPLFSYQKFDFTNANKFRLTITKPNAALQRQQQALDAFFEDRLIEPRLKEIFLAPTACAADMIAKWWDYDIDWSSQLTESQMNAVKTALSAKHIAMIQGPPGTGKTTVIVEMLYQILNDNPKQRILVVSQQNTAVDNAIVKFKEKHPHLVSKGVNVVRVGNLTKIADEIIEDHFDTIFTQFIEYCLTQSLNKVNSIEDVKLDALYEWRALLTQIKESGGQHNVSDEFFTTMLMDKNIIGATCVGLAARKAGVDHLSFDVAIVDEAGRATVPELLIPLLRSKKAILIGDHHQLPPSIAPVLREDSAKEEMSFLEETFLEHSFFEMLFEQLPKACTAQLTEQFRMAAPIGNLVAKLFYSKDGENRLTNGSKDPLNTSDFAERDCLIWVDVWGRQQKPHGTTSFENEAEAKAIQIYLIDLSNRFTRKIDVAVITPYGAQKRLIRKLLQPYGTGQIINVGTLSIKVDTVDSFQGSEAELVCYSTVRTHGSLQFILDKKRLNVACSRAKENLIFFGNKRHLESHESEGKNLYPVIISSAEKYAWKNSKISKIDKKSLSSASVAD
ncbi:DEAD/DEAH box helicase [Rheinheimera maricola]|uniref:AAA family ATPase n=1 Tax=Rheinheimera maricola TaxID=2793282 RepID=A0ABS7X5M2_9GAMM|nr:AAA domain-containing protein [Rheinheimera maricola]MBZ9610846.1 AAA family ATPase [Rheinheimera maricola]